EGVTLDILLQCTDAELMLLTKRVVDKIKLRIAIDKLKTTQQSFNGSKSSDLYVSLPVREDILCENLNEEPITNDKTSQQLPITTSKSSDLYVSLPIREASGNCYVESKTNDEKLISEPKLTSTPITLKPASPGSSTAYILTDSLIELNDEDYSFLKNVDVSHLGKETGRSLHHLLSSCTFGKVLLEKASRGEKLNSRDRAFIVKLIVETELRSLNTVTNSIRKEIWENWANEVVFLFKDEAKNIYYIPYHVVGGKVIQASGLFQNRLITHRRLLAISTNNKRKSSTSSEGSDCGVIIQKQLKRNRPLPESFKSFSDANVTAESCLDWLRNSSSPCDLVAAKWVATFELRNKILSEGLSHEEYFKTFPALTLSNGHKLLSLDFQSVYPNADRVFDERFPIIKTRILTLLTEKGGSSRVDESTLELLNLAS
ncbi:hypothetical protein ACJJTC_013756, partial [Scirpophaga incertulas]